MGTVGKMIKILFSVSIVLIIGADGACPDGWTRYQNSCYMFKDDTALTWHNAKTACTDMHGYLVRIDTSAENNFLRQALNDHGKHYYWIDGNDMSVEGDWILDNGDKATFFDCHEKMGLIEVVTSVDPDHLAHSCNMLRATDEPNNYADEDCVDLNGFADYHWNDYDCNTAIAFICELEDPVYNGCQPVVG